MAAALRRYVVPAVLLALTTSSAQDVSSKEISDCAEAFHFRCRFAMEWFGQPFHKRALHSCNPKVIADISPSKLLIPVRAFLTDRPSQQNPAN
jgi:hypothetical protein